MLHRSISIYCHRTLRSLNKRIAEPVEKLEASTIQPAKPVEKLNTSIEQQELTNEGPIVPLDESDLQRLSRHKTEESLSNTESTLLKIGNIEELTNKQLTQKPKKKRKLLDFKLEIPLTEPITLENQFEKLNEVVTPLHKIPYNVQLNLKQDHIRSVLFSLKKELRKHKVPLGPSFEKMPCPVEKIYPSPEIISYRNKDEFSVHVGVDGNPKTVGYFVSVPKDPLMRCVNPTHLINIRESHKLIAQHFQNFIQNSRHKTCLYFREGGVWRNLVTRSTLKDERMASVYIYPKDLEDGEKEEIKEQLKHYFFRGEGAQCQLTSLYLQACQHARCSRETAPYELIEGKERITEDCLGLQFRISPDSFFQTNTKTAEILYETVTKVAEVSPFTTILDICCGTGTISTILAPHVRGAIGIDVITGAIDDAKINAEINNVNNINYIAGKVEKILPILLDDLKDCTEVIAVMNPARAGLNATIMETIRSCPSIKKLVYVCCKPEGNAAGNLALLGSTLPWKKSFSKKIDPGDPFVPTYCVPIDMFPHTLHTEYVILLERVELK